MNAATPDNPAREQDEAWLTPERRDYLKSLDLSDRELREDLRIAREILDGEWPEGIDFRSPAGGLSGPLTFRIGDTYVWVAVSGSTLHYQIADVANGRFTNHRGRFTSLRESLQSVLREKGITRS